MKHSFIVNLARPGKHQLTFEAQSMKLPAHQGSLGIMANRQALLTIIEQVSSALPTSPTARCSSAPPVVSAR